ncbi:hypothetical protein OG21DRAFT_1525936 [Imleria badia]|nr:hypothetical protein OG21DRAFT_1525936 [Imleria badia]
MPLKRCLVKLVMALWLLDRRQSFMKAVMLPTSESLDDIKKFPWYCRMALLVGGNPNHSQNSISNNPTVEDDEMRTCLTQALLFESPLLTMRGTIARVKRAADVPAVSQPAKKRKTPQDLIKEVADAEREYVSKSSARLLVTLLSSWSACALRLRGRKEQLNVHTSWL